MAQYRSFAAVRTAAFRSIRLWHTKCHTKSHCSGATPGLLIMSLRRFFVLAAPIALLLLPSLASNVLAEEPSGLLGTVKEERLVIAGKLRSEVENSLAAARRTMADDPARAEQE